MVLARTHRPSTFKDLIGQTLLVETLSNAIQTNSLPHAFLFHGIRGTGKTTTARILSRCLNCEATSAPTIEPCGTCGSCAALASDRHMDVLEIDAASHTSVDNVREMIESSKYKPVQGRYKIFIIDEAHMLSRSAFNALLKTLEEPPPHVKFMLATTELKKVPDTILSRCMCFDLKRMDPNILAPYLNQILGKEGISIEEDALALIVRSGEGSARDSLSLLDRAIALSSTNQKREGAHVSTFIVKSMLGATDRSLLFSAIDLILSGEAEGVWKLTYDFVRQGGAPLFFLNDLLDVVYWCTAIKKAPSLVKDITWPRADREEGARIAEKLSLSVLLRLWQALLQGYEEVKKAPYQDQALDMLLLKLCFVKELPPIEDVLKAFAQGTHSLSGGEGMQSLSQSVIADHSPSLSVCSIQEVETELVLPENFSCFLEYLIQKREVLLSNELSHFAHLIEYRPGYLHVRLNEKAPLRLRTQLRPLLERVTGILWTLKISDCGGEVTVSEKNRRQEDAEVNQILVSPLLQSLKDAFPDMTVSVQPLH